MSKPLRYQCAHCGFVSTARADEIPDVCPSCQARLGVVKPRPNAPHAKPAPPPPSAPLPIVVQIPTDPFDYIEEKKADLRERREARQENRQYYREDRQSNKLGIIGFAVNVTMMLVLLSGWLFAKSLPAYLYITASLAIPVAIMGLVLCIIAALTPNRQRIFAFVGAGVGAVLVLIMLPTSFMLRDMLEK